MSLLADMKVWKVEYNPRCKFQSSPIHSQDRYSLASLFPQRGGGSITGDPHLFAQIAQKTMIKSELQLSVLDF